MNIIGVILLVLALASFVVSAALSRRPDRHSSNLFLGIGLALWSLAVLLDQLGIRA